MKSILLSFIIIIGSQINCFAQKNADKLLYNGVYYQSYQQQFEDYLDMIRFYDDNTLIFVKGIQRDTAMKEGAYFNKQNYTAIPYQIEKGNITFQLSVDNQDNKVYQISIRKNGLGVKEYQVKNEGKGKLLEMSSFRFMHLDGLEMTTDRTTNKEVASVNNDQNLRKVLSIKSSTFKTRYFEGEKEIEGMEFLKLLEKYNIAYRSYQQGENWNLLGNVIGIPAGLVFDYQAGQLLFQGGAPKHEPFFIASGLLWGGGLTASLIGNAKVRKSLHQYNHSQANIGLNINQNGIGLSLNF